MFNLVYISPAAMEGKLLNILSGNPGFHIFNSVNFWGKALIVNF